MYKEIDDFFQSKAIAIVGVSRDKNHFSHLLADAFIKREYKVYPINPNTDEICEIKCFRSISQVPDDVEAIYIIMRSDLAIDMAREAAARGIRKIWIHVKCNSPEIKDISSKYGISIIAGECFFMWAEPVKGIHRFHRFIRSLFDSRVAF
jgi:predicted CoA-binding protein